MYSKVRILGHSKSPDTRGKMVVSSTLGTFSAGNGYQSLFNVVGRDPNLKSRLGSCDIKVPTTVFRYSVSDEFLS